MRAVLQRVSSASVRVNGALKGSIGKGLLVYAGVELGDGGGDVEFIARKIATLRVFEDSSGKMNLDMKEAGGSVLLVSQFTLHGDLRKGKRPSFDSAEEPQRAKALYEALVEAVRALSIRVETGEFQAHMEVESINDGPVTLLVDSRKAF